MATLAVDISPSFDAIFYGFIVATVLLGVTLCQGWIYFNDNEDKWHLRTVVSLLIVIDLSTTVIQARVLHHYLVANFGSLDALANIPYDMHVEISILTPSVVLIVQTFFAFRVLRLNPGRYGFPICILLAAIAGFGLAIERFARIMVTHQTSMADWTNRDREIETMVDCAMCAVSDVLATIALTRLLSRVKSGIKRTDSVLKQLLIIIVTRGILVTTAQILQIIVYPIDSSTTLAIHFIHTKLYSITMIAMLNARPSLHRQIDYGTVKESQLVFGLNSTYHNTQTQTQRHEATEVTLDTIGESVSKEPTLIIERPVLS